VGKGGLRGGERDRPVYRGGLTRKEIFRGSRVPRRERAKRKGTDGQTESHISNKGEYVEGGSRRARKSAKPRSKRNFGSVKKRNAVPGEKNRIHQKKASLEKFYKV